MGFISYGMDYFDASNMLSVYKGGGRHDWDNAQYDDLLAEGAAAFNKSKRPEIYTEAQVLLTSQAPAVFVFHGLGGYLSGLTSRDRRWPRTTSATTASSGQASSPSAPTSRACTSPTTWASTPARARADCCKQAQCPSVTTELRLIGPGPLGARRRPATRPAERAATWSGPGGRREQPQMVSYLAKRFLSLLFTLFLATIAIFAMMHSVPGGPFSFTQGVMSAAAMHNIMVQATAWPTRSGSSTSSGSGSCCTATWASPSRSRR